MAEKEIINRISESSIKTFDLEEIYTEGERLTFDLEQVLFQGLILREKDLKSFIQTHDWKIYEGKFVAIFCSADAIIPNWAYLQVLTALSPFANKMVCGSREDLDKMLFEEALAKVDWSQYEGQKVVIKGCSKVNVPLYVYGRACEELQKVAKLIAYGEACSSVPIWKKPKNNPSI